MAIGAAFLPNPSMVADLNRAGSDGNCSVEAVAGEYAPDIWKIGTVVQAAAQVCEDAHKRL